MGDEEETASPSADPPEEPQESVHGEPEEPSDGDRESEAGASPD
jgi:hypothetical protein